MEEPKDVLSRKQFLVGAGIAGLSIAGVGLVGCSPSGGANGSGDGDEDSGPYIGVAQGRGGPIVVSVDLADDKLDAIQVLSESETYTVGGLAIESMAKSMVDNQSLGVDTVAGATISTAAFKTAVQNALERAGRSADDFKGEVKADEKPEDTSADVVVIGSGGAGLTAAIYAAKAGKKTILLEKLGVLGGTSNYSIEGYGSVGDKTHMALGSDLTAEQLAANLLKTYPNGTPEGFATFAQNNGKGADWLRSIGAQLTVAAGQAGVATSREVGDLGVAIVAALSTEAEKAGVDVRRNSAVTDITATNGTPTGVSVSAKGGDYTITTKAVVIACGGFGANNDMVAEYFPPMKGYDYACSKGATGEIHKVAEKLGAELANMDYIRVNFTYTTAESGYFYYMGSLFNTGAIFVNEEGKRFVNDQGGYGVGPQVVEKEEGTGWAIFDSSIVHTVEDVRDYGRLNLYESAETIEDLAEKIGVNATNLAQTIETYRGYVAAGKDAEFNRPMLNMTFDEPPFYACKMTCRVQGTFGGIRTNVNAEVLKPDGTVIPGLYAVGECAEEGTWGQNPASANVVFGRIAGENAAKFAV